MDRIGFVSKMRVNHTVPVSYALPVDPDEFSLNEFLGKTVSLQYLHENQCTACQQPIKKTYQDGYCFPCTQKLAACDLCIVKPERCHFNSGTCREPLWAQNHCFAPHVVYLANASGIKVGITRKSQIPTRWIDQGAIEAMPLFEVNERRISGFVEMVIAKHISDKTNWRKMLSHPGEKLPIELHRNSILEDIKIEVKSLEHQFGETSIKLVEPEVYHFTYPVLEYPKKIVSLSFDKTDLIEGTLLGIKGQYLLFDKGVLNIRKHTGYKISLRG